MEHVLSDDFASLQRLRDELFPAIARGDTILFLGAGVSVGPKRYLTREVLELFSAKTGLGLDTTDPADFVETLSENPSFSRNQFDETVVELLSRLEVTRVHELIVTTPWRQVYGTNQDILIEKAYDRTDRSAAYQQKYLVCRNRRELITPARDEVLYVKLCGCISDRSRYPLVWSHRDFEAARAFHRTSMAALEHLSPAVHFLSIGYSYSDAFSKALLERLDKFGFRQHRSLYHVDPYVQDARLPYLAANGVCAIRLTAESFLSHFREWEDETFASRNDGRGSSFTSRAGRRVQMPARLQLRLGNGLVQLQDTTTQDFINPQDYYRGREPNYGVIARGLDVTRERAVEQVRPSFTVASRDTSTLVPLLILTGTYGVGKTTFCYRLIHDLLTDAELSALAFQVTDVTSFGTSDLEGLFREAGAKTYLLFFNGIDVDSTFKSLMSLRYKLSAEQYHEFQIVMIASMRENVFARQVKDKNYAGIVELPVDWSLNTSEVRDLIDKLTRAGLVETKDVAERVAMAERLLVRSGGDALVTLIDLVADGTHASLISGAYRQLPGRAQQALVYTSLLHRFRLDMPAGLCRAILGGDWAAFTSDVLKNDCRGLLLQEMSSRPGTSPDLCLRTRHPIIADRLVDQVLQSEDAQFEHYRALVRRLSPSPQDATLVVDLLKALRVHRKLSQSKIDVLFNDCAQTFVDDPHFNIHFAMNLQYRGDEESLLRGLRRLQYAQSMGSERNHRLIHRRALLNFRLAELYFDRETELDKTYDYVREARQLFNVKAILDPFSSYSYVDHLKLEMWCLDRLVMDDEATAAQRVSIEDLFDRAEEAVLDGMEFIVGLKARYLEIVGRSSGDDREYLAYLAKLLADERSRPSGMILSYYHAREMQDSLALDRAAAGLEEYRYRSDVSRVLFRHYGKNLHIADNRVKLFELSRDQDALRERDPARYHFYNAIAEAYDRRFGDCFDHLRALRQKVDHISPALREDWRDAETGLEKVFDAVVVRRDNWVGLKIIDLQQTFPLRTNRTGANQQVGGRFRVSCG